MAQARVKFGPGWRGLKAHLENLPEEMDRWAVETTSRIAEEGANEMQGNIVHSGRVDTTLMYRSVKHKAAKSSYYYARFGWLDRYEDYFKYQEQGFFHVGAGREIPPMHAMFQAFIHAREKLRAEVEKVTKR